MNGDGAGRVGEGPDGPERNLSEEEMGDPVEELRLLEEVPSEGFLTRLRGRLRRRDLGAQLVRLGWGGVGEVFMEFVKIVLSIFETKPRDQGGDR